MIYSYRFTSTHQDLLDSFNASRTAELGMRRFARVGVAGLGLMWLAGALLSPFFPMRPQHAVWLPILWLGLGGSLTWKFVVQPWLVARDIRRFNPSEQNVAVTFGDAGLTVDVQALGVYRRSWEEVIGMLPASKGIGFGFSDGTTHWLPNRVFATEAEREALVEYVRGKAFPPDNESA